MSGTVEESAGEFINNNQKRIPSIIPSAYIKISEGSINKDQNLEELFIQEQYNLKSKFWIPEDFGFIPRRLDILNSTITREDIFYKDYYDLRRMSNDKWLCRKKVKNKNGNTEYLVRFYLKIESTDIEIAKYLLTKGLE